MWSFAWLVFLNFFNQYIACYRLETVGGVSQWVRYPVLTADFDSWLLALTVVAVLTIIAHVVLIIIDRYLLREAMLIALNLLGLSLVVQLLALFPFNFSNIPSATMSDVLPVVTTVVLICASVGLGIAALVGFIRVVVHITRGTAGY